MSANEKPSFGFGSLDDIAPGRLDEPAAAPPVRAPREQPTPRPKPQAAAVERTRAEVLREADRAAERLGFASREAAPLRRRKRQPLEEPVDQLNMRAAITDINRFVEWCEQKRYSYREGFAELVKHID